MNVEEALRKFPEQFEWEPHAEYNEVLRPHKYYLVCGMGGSHLGAWLLKRYGDLPNIFIHRDYGLPALPPDIMNDALVILSSHSGTTEEVLDSGRAALERGLPIAIATTGGKLLEFAREHALPHVVTPRSGLEPRMAVGYSMLALARLMGNLPLESAIREGGRRADPLAGKAEGARIAEVIRARIPVIYSSAANIALAYIWKIKLNETSKIPACINVFPELCHNELSGYDVADSTRPISERLHAVFLEDFADHPRVRERMRVASEILAEKGIPVERMALAGKTGFEKALNSALLADWVSYNLAEEYGVPNPETPLIAEFKRRIGQ